MRLTSILRRGSVLLVAAGAIALMPAFDWQDQPHFDVARADLPAKGTIAASAPGIVEPLSEQRDLAATVTGRITNVAAEGQAVTKGQIVAEIDNADLKARLAAAEAQIEMRKAELQRLLNGAREEERRAAKAELAKAVAAENLAKLVLQRKRPLAKTGVASSDALDRARADFDSAVANTKMLTEHLAMLDRPPRPEDVAIAQANLEAAKADADAIRADIEKTRLRSPVDGVVLRRYKSVGETVAVLPPTLIATVGDISHLRVRADVDEADVAKVAVGQKAWVTADAYGDHRFYGIVSKVGESLGPKRIRTDDPAEKLDTKVLRVMIDLKDGGRLPVGLRVDVFFEPSDAKNKLANTRETVARPAPAPQPTPRRSNPTIDTPSGLPAIE